MFTLEDLIDIVKSESLYHRDAWERLKSSPSKHSDTSQLYRHHHLHMAMEEIHSLLSDKSKYITNDSSPSNDPGKGKDNTDAIQTFSEVFFNATHEMKVSKQKPKILDYLNHIEEFEGRDPFDTNLKLITRIDPLITYLMSDCKQRTFKSCTKELKYFLPNEEIEEKIVGRRMYVLDKKKGILEQKGRGNYRIKEDYSMNSINNRKNIDSLFE